ncbi:MAG: alpha/beta fold hydrolase [Bacteroidota bacterium]
MELFLNETLGKITYEVHDTPISEAVLLIAHGAGTDLNHPFLKQLAEKIYDHGISVIRFNFPFMEKGKRPPTTPQDALTTWHKMIMEAIKLFHFQKIYIGGKSYGGRMASILLAENSELAVNGVIYYGFPLHPPGKESKDRATHLDKIKLPQLFIQGTNDKLAAFSLIEEVVKTISDASLIPVKEADHSFVRPKSKATISETTDQIAEETARWISKR